MCNVVDLQSTIYHLPRDTGEALHADFSWLRITGRHERVILASTSLVVSHPWAVVHADASSLEGSLAGGQPWTESWHSTSGRIEGACQCKEESDSEEDELHFVWNPH